MLGNERAVQLVLLAVVIACAVLSNIIGGAVGATPFLGR
jgi:hypothetical protein